MTTNMKNSIKRWAYKTGMLGAYHHVRNRKRLTVAMFHRVLPDSDPRHAGADPEWTMTTESFAQCLEFFRRHYHVVSPDQVFSALRGDIQLPDRSLLVTFDDGWADTAEYAQPILDKFSFPALIFVAGRAIDQAAPFWEECIYSFLATCPNSLSQLAAQLQNAGIDITFSTASATDEKNIRATIQQLEELDRHVLEAVACSLDPSWIARPAMLGSAQLTQLVGAQHTIGGHGMTHRPLTRLQDVDEELRLAYNTISNSLGSRPVASMSFPHGAYSESIMKKCETAGYQYLFSSDPCLSAIGGNKTLKPRDPIGRIHISERAILDKAGKFQPDRLATWLFLRPSRQIS